MLKLDAEIQNEVLGRTNPKGSNDTRTDHNMKSAHRQVEKSADASNLSPKEAQDVHLTAVELTKKVGRRRKLLEPEHLQAVSKECPHCCSQDTRFQYFSNNKETQPRYKCRDCAGRFTYYGSGNKKCRHRPPEVEPAFTSSTSTFAKVKGPYCPVVWLVYNIIFVFSFLSWPVRKTMGCSCELVVIN